jgi:hypothetical protein
MLIQNVGLLLDNLSSITLNKIYTKRSHLADIIFSNGTENQTSTEPTNKGNGDEMSLCIFHPVV